MPASVDEEECISCGSCVNVCPVDAIELEDVAVIDAESCIDCGSCISKCPVDAISL
ncbi:ferredoxin [archaeon SCG-AAA382B04]|nr:ferredoxin [archaeon SCG-AAA382B04]